MMHVAQQHHTSCKRRVRQLCNTHGMPNEDFVKEDYLHALTKQTHDHQYRTLNVTLHPANQCAPHLLQVGDLFLTRDKTPFDSKRE